jgi:hypothetical protein
MPNKFALVVFFTITLQIASWSESNNYQYYIPVESDKVDKFISAALKELAFFGKADVPIKEVHIRQSQIREEPQLYSRADITDWPELQKSLNKLISQKSFLRRYFNFSAVEIQTKNQKLRIIKSLNKMIEDKDFYSPERFPKISLTDQQNKDAGNGFWGSFSSDATQLNRSLLDQILTTSVNKFTSRKKPHINMQFCELANEKRGIFVIYLKHETGTDAFYCELAHELFHTINAKIYDWNAEGLASLFSEEFVSRQGKDWSYFRNVLADKNRPYGASYHMLKDLYKKSRPSFKNIMTFHKPWQKMKRKIDTKSWLKTTNPTFQQGYTQQLQLFAPAFKKRSTNYIGFN